MRRALTLLFAGLLAGCSEPGYSIEGTLAGDWPSASLWIDAGDGDRVQVENGHFLIQDLAKNEVALRFLDGDGEIARMLVTGMGSGATRLLRIGRPSGGGTVFPSAVELAEGDWITVNGVRFADRGGIGGQVASRGIVLALDGGDRAILVRPIDSGQPDLAVLLDDDADLVDADRNPLRLRDLEPGDTIEVEGEASDGVVRASRLTAAILAPAARTSETQSGGTSSSPRSSSSLPGISETPPERSAVRPSTGPPGRKNNPGKGNGKPKKQGNPGRGKGPK